MQPSLPFPPHHSPAGGHTGQQRLPCGWGLVLEWRDVQPTSADSAPVRRRQWQHEAWPRRPEPVRQRHVCTSVQPPAWLPVQAGHEEGKELPQYLLEPPSVHHSRWAIGGMEVWVKCFGVRLRLTLILISGLKLVESFPYETVQRDYDYVRLASITAGKFLVKLTFTSLFRNFYPF